MKRYKQPAFITGMLDNSSIQVDGGVMNVNTAPWLAPGDAFTGNVKTTYASGNAVKLTEQDLKGTWTELAFAAVMVSIRTTAYMRTLLSVYLVIPKLTGV